MTDAVARREASGSIDPALAERVDELIRRLQAGEPVDPSGLDADDPARAEQLRRLLPTLEQLAELGLSGPGSGPGPSGPGALGEYRIVREVGRGGMGVVYEAVQQSLGRRVALKVLPFAAALEAQHLARFKLEAQAAAQLHHAHIVPVYAVGCERGVHYFAMQFVEGRTLADVVAELRRLEAEQPRPAPTPEAPASGGLTALSTRSRAFCRAVAGLGAQAAEALDHAHRLGIVHRDVKPANLMVDDAGHLWVADFGLALVRGGDGEALTRTGDAPGTLRYMSPEQAGAGPGVVDHRTDVYSLGLTLYELLTLRPAVEGRDRAEILRRVASDDPRPPRRANPSIPVDLETIVLKALAKEPEARYATAREMADDLRRFLDDRPVAARRPTPWARAARFARRHRAAAASSAVALVLALAAGAAATWVQKERAEAALDELDRVRRRDREAMLGMLARANDLALNAMQKISAFEYQAGKGLDERFYRFVIGYYEGIAALAGDDPDTREIAARANFGSGIAQMMLEDPAAEATFLRCVEQYRALADAEPGNAQYLQDLAMTSEWLGGYALKRGGLAAAGPHYRRSVEARRALDARHPGERYRNYLLAGLLSWAKVLKVEGRRAEAAATFDEVLALDPEHAAALEAQAVLLAARPGEPPHDPSRAADLARRAAGRPQARPGARFALGLALARLGDWDGALAALAGESGPGPGPDPDPGPDARLVLALVDAGRGDPDEARRGVEAVKAAWRDAPPADPDRRAVLTELEARLGLGPGPPGD